MEEYLAGYDDDDGGGGGSLGLMKSFGGPLSRRDSSSSSGSSNAGSGGSGSEGAESEAGIDQDINEDDYDDMDDEDDQIDGQKRHDERQHLDDGLSTPSSSPKSRQPIPQAQARQNAVSVGPKVKYNDGLSSSEDEAGPSRLRASPARKVSPTAVSARSGDSPARHSVSRGGSVGVDEDGGSRDEAMESEDERVDDDEPEGRKENFADDQDAEEFDDAEDPGSDTAESDLRVPAGEFDDISDGLDSDADLNRLTDSDSEDEHGIREGEGSLERRVDGHFGSDKDGSDHTDEMSDSDDEGLDNDKGDNDTRLTYELDADDDSDYPDDLIDPQIDFHASAQGSHGAEDTRLEYESLSLVPTNPLDYPAPPPAQSSPAQGDSQSSLPSLSSYKQDLRTHIASTTSRSLSLLPEFSVLHDTVLPPLYRPWTVEDRSKFFIALVRHSRWRPDLIAGDIGRTEGEVNGYIEYLERGKKAVEAKWRRDRKILQRASQQGSGYREDSQNGAPTLALTAGKKRKRAGSHPTSDVDATSASQPRVCSTAGADPVRKPQSVDPVVKWRYHRDGFAPAAIEVDDTWIEREEDYAAQIDQEIAEESARRWRRDRSRRWTEIEEEVESAFARLRQRNANMAGNNSRVVKGDEAGKIISEAQRRLAIEFGSTYEEGRGWDEWLDADKLEGLRKTLGVGRMPSERRARAKGLFGAQGEAAESREVEDLPGEENEDADDELVKLEEVLERSPVKNVAPIWTPYQLQRQEIRRKRKDVRRIRNARRMEVLGDVPQEVMNHRAMMFLSALAQARRKRHEAAQVRYPDNTSWAASSSLLGSALMEIRVRLMAHLNQNERERAKRRGEGDVEGPADRAALLRQWAGKGSTGKEWVRVLLLEKRERQQMKQEIAEISGKVFEGGIDEDHSDDPLNDLDDPDVCLDDTTDHIYPEVLTSVKFHKIPRIRLRHRPYSSTEYADDSALDFLSAFPKGLRTPDMAVLFKRLTRRIQGRRLSRMKRLEQLREAGREVVVPSGDGPEVDTLWRNLSGNRSSGNEEMDGAGVDGMVDLEKEVALPDGRKMVSGGKDWTGEEWIRVLLQDLRRNAGLADDARPVDPTPPRTAFDKAVHRLEDADDGRFATLIALFKSHEPGWTSASLTSAPDASSNSLPAKTPQEGATTRKPPRADTKRARKAAAKKEQKAAKKLRKAQRRRAVVEREVLGRLEDVVEVLQSKKQVLCGVGGMDEDEIARRRGVRRAWRGRFGDLLGLDAHRGGDHDTVDADTDINLEGDDEDLAKRLVDICIADKAASKSHGPSDPPVPAGADHLPAVSDGQAGSKRLMRTMIGTQFPVAETSIVDLAAIKYLQSRPGDLSADEESVLRFLRKRRSRPTAKALDPASRNAPGVWDDLAPEEWVRVLVSLLHRWNGPKTHEAIDVGREAPDVAPGGTGEATGSGVEMGQNAASAEPSRFRGFLARLFHDRPTRGVVLANDRRALEWLESRPKGERTGWECMVLKYLQKRLEGISKEDDGGEDEAMEVDAEDSGGRLVYEEVGGEDWVEALIREGKGEGAIPRVSRPVETPVKRLHFDNGTLPPYNLTEYLDERARNYFLSVDPARLTKAQDKIYRLIGARIKNRRTRRMKSLCDSRDLDGEESGGAGMTQKEIKDLGGVDVSWRIWAGKQALKLEKEVEAQGLVSAMDGTETANGAATAQSATPQGCGPENEASTPDHACASNDQRPNKREPKWKRATLRRRQAFAKKKAEEAQARVQAKAEREERRAKERLERAKVQWMVPGPTIVVDGVEVDTGLRGMSGREWVRLVGRVFEVRRALKAGKGDAMGAQDEDEDAVEDEVEAEEDLAMVKDGEGSAGGEAGSGGDGSVPDDEEMGDPRAGEARESPESRNVGENDHVQDSVGPDDLDGSATAEAEDGQAGPSQIAPPDQSTQTAPVTSQTRSSSIQSLLQYQLLPRNVSQTYDALAFAYLSSRPINHKPTDRPKPNALSPEEKELRTRLVKKINARRYTRLRTLRDKHGLEKDEVERRGGVDKVWCEVAEPGNAQGRLDEGMTGEKWVRVLLAEERGDREVDLGDAREGDGPDGQVNNGGDAQEVRAENGGGHGAAITDGEDRQPAGEDHAAAGPGPKPGTANGAGNIAVDREDNGVTSPNGQAQACDLVVKRKRGGDYSVKTPSINRRTSEILDAKAFEWLLAIAESTRTPEQTYLLNHIRYLQAKALEWRERALRERGWTEERIANAGGVGAAWWSRETESGTVAITGNQEGESVNGTEKRKGLIDFDVVQRYSGKQWAEERMKRFGIWRRGANDVEPLDMELGGRAGDGGLGRRTGPARKVDVLRLGMAGDEEGWNGWDVFDFGWLSRRFGSQDIDRETVKSMTGEMLHFLRAELERFMTPLIASSITISEQRRAMEEFGPIDSSEIDVKPQVRNEEDITLEHVRTALALHGRLPLDLNKETRLESGQAGKGSSYRISYSEMWSMKPPRSVGWESMWIDEAIKKDARLGGVKEEKSEAVESSVPNGETHGPGHTERLDKADEDDLWEIRSTKTDREDEELEEMRERLDEVVDRGMGKRLRDGAGDEAAQDDIVDGDEAADGQSPRKRRRTRAALQGLGQEMAQFASHPLFRGYKRRYVEIMKARRRRHRRAETKANARREVAMRAGESRRKGIKFRTDAVIDSDLDDTSDAGDDDGDDSSDIGGGARSDRGSGVEERPMPLHFESEDDGDRDADDGGNADDIDTDFDEGLEDLDVVDFDTEEDLDDDDDDMMTDHEGDDEDDDNIEDEEEKSADEDDIEDIDEEEDD